MWVLAGAGLIVGIGIGYLICYTTSRRSAGQTAAKIKSEFDEYRKQVELHFTKTSELFQGVTHQYRELYQHLAGGAQTLCESLPDTPELELADRSMLPERPQSAKRKEHDQGSQTDEAPSAPAPPDAKAADIARPTPSPAEAATAKPTAG